jgi:hypothetical protein
LKHLKGRAHFGKLGVAEITILKWELKKYDVIV